MLKIVLINCNTYIIYAKHDRDTISTGYICERKGTIEK